MFRGMVLTIIWIISVVVTQACLALISLPSGVLNRRHSEICDTGHSTTFASNDIDYSTGSPSTELEASSLVYRSLPGTLDYEWLMIVG
jgi:hypothetical protein